MRFNEPVDPSSISPDKLFVQQWNYTDSLHTYGSGEYSIKQPDKLGHDRTPVDSITLSADGKELFINAPTIQPAMCTQIYRKLKSTTGSELTLDLYATITGFFDDRAGRETVERPIGPKVPYTKDDLNYAWIQKNILTANTCVACHQAGTQHDFSSYEEAAELHQPQ